MRTSFKVLIVLLLFISLAMLGCSHNGKTSGIDNNQTEKPLDLNYSGQYEGCMETYDPLFCPDYYKPPLGLKGLNYVK